MSAIMSDMETATFTLRDLNRQPAKVLEACDRLGSVHIRTREGRRYTLKLEVKQTRMGQLPDFKARRARLRKLGMKPLPMGQQRRFDQWLAGEL